MSNYRIMADYSLFSFCQLTVVTLQRVGDHLTGPSIHQATVNHTDSCLFSCSILNFINFPFYIISKVPQNWIMVVI